MSTKITYNGKTTELADGYIATLLCKDLKMETDVVVEAPEPAESGGGGGGAELNIAYGDTAPEDTSKLWVKTTQPSAVKVSKNVTFVGSGETYRTLEAELSENTLGCGVGAVGEKIYIFGGRLSTGSYDNRIYCFDTTTKTIETLATTLPAMYGGQGVAVIGKMIYLIGGIKDGKYTQEILRFDTETKTITTLTATTQDTAGFVCATAVGTDIWVYGHAGNRFWKFDAISESITVTSLVHCPLPCTSIQADGDYLYAFGGFRSTGMTGMLTVISRVDLVIQTSTVIAQLPTKKGQMASAKIHSRIYLFGGDTNAYGYGAVTGSNTVYCFDTETETITTLSVTLGSNKVGLHSATSVGETCYIFGGKDTNDIDEFSPNLKVSVAQNNLHILSSLTGNSFKLINTDTAQVEIGVNKVYKGNADGIAEEVKAALHNGTSWVTI